jgi:hypothetical protein
VTTDDQPVEVCPIRLCQFRNRQITRRRPLWHSLRHDFQAWHQHDEGDFVSSHSDGRGGRLIVLERFCQGGQDNIRIVAAQCTPALIQLVLNALALLLDASVLCGDLGRRIRLGNGLGVRSLRALEDAEFSRGRIDATTPDLCLVNRRRIGCNRRLDGLGLDPMNSEDRLEGSDQLLSLSDLSRLGKLTLSRCYGGPVRTG